jgi:hypothetical protein
MTTKWGPWVKFEGDNALPQDEAMKQMIEVAYISPNGQLKYQTANLFSWEFSDTVAYRLAVMETTQVLYGSLGGAFSFVGLRVDNDTHKITYTVDQHGDVLSCEMEKLK